MGADKNQRWASPQVEPKDVAFLPPTGFSEPKRIAVVSGERVISTWLGEQSGEQSEPEADAITLALVRDTNSLLETYLEQIVSFAEVLLNIQRADRR